MSRPTFSAALAMGLSSVATAFACGFLATTGALHIAAVCLLACLAFGASSACEFAAAWKRRQRRHAPFIRPARPTDRP